MRRWVKMSSIAALLAVACAVPVVQAVSERAMVRSMSGEEVDGYLQGRGMGMAKPAELNRYPGPRHVLDLAAELELTDDQIARTQKLYDTMQAGAMKYGRQFVANEQALEKLFAAGEADASRLDTLLKQSADIKARLRAVHLEAHIAQKQLLTEAQINRYVHLRGYGDGHHGGAHAHHR